MSVHQINEFFIDIETPDLSNKANVQKAKQFTENNGYDFLLDDSLIIETFNSESEAKQFEDQVLEILRA
jgi:hypothetical protein